MKFKIFNRKKIEEKALSLHDFLDIDCGLRYIGPNYSHGNVQEFVNYNMNFVYACTRKIEQYISAVPVHLYSWTNNPNKLLISNHLVDKELKAFIKKQSRITKKAMDMVEIEEHPLVELLKYPAPNMSYADWIGLNASYLLLTGNSLMEILKDGETIIGLMPLKWEYVQPQIDNGVIMKYRYNDPQAKPRTFMPDEVVHIRAYAPGNIAMGRGSMSACIDSARLYKYYDEYQITLANNYALPGLSFNVKNRISNNCNTKISSEEEAKKIADKFIQKFSKVNNGKPLVTFGDVEIKPLGFPPKEMEYAVGRRWAKKTICAAFGVPEDLISTEDSNRASSITAINQFRSITIYPLLSRILDQVNTQIVTKYYDENAFIWFDPVETQDNDPSAQANILNSYVNSGIMTVNEARAILGMEPLEEETETPAPQENQMNEDINVQIIEGEQNNANRN